MRNPFKPGFNTKPTVLWGRESELSRIEAVSLDFDQSDYGRATIVTGNRGVGKTTLLYAAADRAEQLNIPVLKIGAKRDFLSNMNLVVNRQIEQMTTKDRRFSVQEITAGLNAFSINLGSIKWMRSPAYLNDRGDNFGKAFRTLLKLIIDQGHPGLLIMIDELNFKYARGDTLDQIITFAGAYQDMIGEGLPVSTILSGLPMPLERAKRNEHISFLSRSQSLLLSEFDYPSSMAAIRKTVNAGRVTACDDAVAKMAALSRGNSYMLQEIGSLSFKRSDRDTIRVENVEAARDEFMNNVSEQVVAVAYNELTPKQRLIVCTLAINPEITPKELATVLGTQDTGLPAYRRDLVESGILVAVPGQRGRYVIAFPYMREYAAALDGDDDGTAYARVTGFPEA